ncbi:hypothetical protein, partial [Flavobacterium aquidurense]|uniref:hypothetical protein n=1 Tax=Flavobacterium aquidurense TaxID=362413 RepID=UPI0037566ED4
LSFKNPHHLFDGDFLFYKILQLCGSPDSYRGSVAFFLKTLFLRINTKICGAAKIKHKYWLV